VVLLRLFLHPPVLFPLVVVVAVHTMVQLGMAVLVVAVVLLTTQPEEQEIHHQLAHPKEVMVALVALDRIQLLQQEVVVVLLLLVAMLLLLRVEMAVLAQLHQFLGRL
jgi:hypothetical protein